jgi:hypothetical protein
MLWMERYQKDKNLNVILWLDQRIWESFAKSPVKPKDDGLKINPVFLLPENISNV